MQEKLFGSTDHNRLWEAYLPSADLVSYTVCNFPTVFHPMLKYSKASPLHHARMLLSAETRRLPCGYGWFEAFCGGGIQNGGSCIGSDTLYCWENSEECAEKGVTQNSKHNRFLSAPADECPFLLFHAARSLRQSESSGRSPCVCARQAGVARGLFTPGSQLTPEVMPVTLSVGAAAFLPFVLCRSFTDASALSKMVSGGMWPAGGGQAC